MNDQADGKTKITVWYTWELTYRPFPALLKDKGFEYFMDTIAEVVHDAEHEDMQNLIYLFGDVHLSGHFDREIMFAVDEPSWLNDPNPFQMPAERATDVYQEMVAALLRRIGLEGVLGMTQRVATIMRGPE